MSQKQNPVDLGLFVAGFMLVIGSISPWISIAIMNVAGIDGWRGYITLLAGLVIALTGATRLWPQLLDFRFGSKLLVASRVLVIGSLAVLVEVAIRLKQVADELSDIESESGASQTTDTVFGDFAKALDDFAKSISDALKPSLAIGWYLCVISAVVSAVLLFVRHTSAPDPAAE
ncbi:MAG: hypothetical protein EBU84_05935 [Actinobacteria bacterium]|nr:hypothetical protein [Actinomycetota bacterium]